MFRLVKQTVYFDIKIHRMENFKTKKNPLDLFSQTLQPVTELN
jgi:hypothetical protein